MSRGIIQLFRASLSEKNVHATIPKSNMGYNQFTVSNTVAVEPSFVAFLLARKQTSIAPCIHSFKFL